MYWDLAKYQDWYLRQLKEQLVDNTLEEIAAAIDDARRVGEPSVARIRVVRDCPDEIVYPFLCDVCGWSAFVFSDSITSCQRCASGRRVQRGEFRGTPFVGRGMPGPYAGWRR